MIAWLAPCGRARPAGGERNGPRQTVSLVPTLPHSRRSRASECSARSYSASALQQFAACPYRFLLYAIHDLEEREEPLPIEKMDPLTRGGMFHQIQFEIFRDLKRVGLLPVDEADLPLVMDIADRILDRVALRWEEKLAPAIPPVWRSEIEDIRTDLRGWVKQLPSIHARSGNRSTMSTLLDCRPAPRARRSAIPRAVNSRCLSLRASPREVPSIWWRSIATACYELPITRPAGYPRGHPVRWAKERSCSLFFTASLAAQKLLGKKVESGVLYYCTQRGIISRSRLN